VEGKSIPEFWGVQNSVATWHGRLWSIRRKESTAWSKERERVSDWDESSGGSHQRGLGPAGDQNTTLVLGEKKYSEAGQQRTYGGKKDGLIPGKDRR